MKKRLKIGVKMTLEIVMSCRMTYDVGQSEYGKVIRVLACRSLHAYVRAKRLLTSQHMMLACDRENFLFNHLV